MDAYINEDAEKSLIGLAMQDAIVAQEVAALSDSLFGLKQMQACQRGIMRLVKQGKNVDLVTLDAEVQCDFQDTALLMQCVQMGISPIMSRQYIAILAECAKRRELATLARKILQDVGNPGVSVESLQADCAAAAQYQNVSVDTFVDVPAGCCTTISVKNTAGVDIDVQNANLIVTRVA